MFIICRVRCGIISFMNVIGLVVVVVVLYNKVIVSNVSDCVSSGCEFRVVVNFLFIFKVLSEWDKYNVSRVLLSILGSVSNVWFRLWIFSELVF